MDRLSRINHADLWRRGALANLWSIPKQFLSSFGSHRQVHSQAGNLDDVLATAESVMQGTTAKIFRDFSDVYSVRPEQHRRRTDQAPNAPDPIPPDKLGLWTEAAMLTAAARSLVLSKWDHFGEPRPEHVWFREMDEALDSEWHRGGLSRELSKRTQSRERPRVG